MAKQIGIDLGTVNVLVYVRGRGVVLREPSVVAIALNDNKIVAVGEEARLMLGRTPDTIEVNRPMKDGVIADYVVTEAMLRYFIRKVVGRFPVFKPDVVISVPAGVTSVERRAVRDAAIQAGARDAFLIPEPLAAGLGAGMPVHTPTGNMVLDIGGGTSEAAVIAMNGIVVSSSIRVGGNKFDEAIANYIRRKYNLLIGEQTAEEVKIEIGSALPLPEKLKMEVRGRDQVAGLPKTLTIASDEVTEALTEPLGEVLKVVKQVLEKTPPELASDVIDRGIVLTGGGALIRNLDRLLTQETGVPCYVAENAIACVAIGAGKALESYEVLKRTLPAA
ncbi:MAG: rod shape-determining protein [Ardenticatenaceae bacterium]|nr:rod shape-determining protein [Ardenticatenaceae bacterium]HBY98121.1 rod shape-determining protein [Chloroflexota bacterium]